MHLLFPYKGKEGQPNMIMPNVTDIKGVFKIGTRVPVHLPTMAFFHHIGYQLCCPFVILHSRSRA